MFQLQKLRPNLLQTVFRMLDLILDSFYATVLAQHQKPGFVGKNLESIRHVAPRSYKE